VSAHNKQARREFTHTYYAYFIDINYMYMITEPSVGGFVKASDYKVRYVCHS